MVDFLVRLLFGDRRFYLPRLVTTVVDDKLEDGGRLLYRADERSTTIILVDGEKVIEVRERLGGRLGGHELTVREKSLAPQVRNTLLRDGSISVFEIWGTRVWEDVGNDVGGLGPEAQSAVLRLSEIARRGATRNLPASVATTAPTENLVGFNSVRTDKTSAASGIRPRAKLGGAVVIDLAARRGRGF